MAAKRLTMRQLREILRLRLGCGLPQRAVATAVKAGKGTVSEYLGLARAAGVGWPIPEELASDEALEARVFGVKVEAQSDRAAVDAPLVHAELRRPGVTLSLLWQEFRIPYSLLDKTAYLLNEYLQLGMREDRVTFRNLWFQSGEQRRGLRPDLERRETLPLRAFYWFAKDLAPEDDVVGTLDPEAQHLALVRNHLEHKFFRLHTEGPLGPTPLKATGAFADTISLHLHERAFERKCLRILRTSRAAIIYLSLAMHRNRIAPQNVHQTTRSGTFTSTPCLLPNTTATEQKRHRRQPSAPLSRCTHLRPSSTREASGLRSHMPALRPDDRHGCLAKIRFPG